MTNLADKRLLFDADSPVYAAIAVAQKNADEEGLEDVPANYAFKALKTTFEGVLQKAGHENVSFYMQGENNFRKEVATIMPYKGNRPPKPALYEDVRDYAVRAWGAVLVNGMEAEDKVAIEYNLDPSNSIMVGQDKDLLQVPGFHYNYRTGEFITISKLEGNFRLWKQILMGDITDSILGIPGTGEKRAEVLLQGVRSYRAGWEVCEAAYKTAFLNKLHRRVEQPNGKMKWVTEPGSGLERHDGTIINWYDALIETGELIYLLRHEGDEFQEASTW